MVTFNDCRKYWLPDKLLDLLPSIYRNMDAQDPQKLIDVGLDMGYTDWGKEGQFERFLHIFENELDRVQCLIEHITEIIDIDRTPCELLPYIAALVGLEPNPDLSCDDQRKEIRDAVNVYRNKGTIFGLTQLIRTFTTFQVQIIEFYKRLLITNNPDTTLLAPAQVPNMYDILNDTSYHKLDGYFYRRNVIGVVLKANACDDSLNATNIKKLKRIIDLYLPVNFVAFIIVIWDCKVDLDVVTNVESHTKWSIIYKTKIGQYYARYFLETNTSWKYTNDVDFIKMQDNLDLNTWQTIQYITETVYEETAPPIPPTATSSHPAGFINYNPFYFGYYYYDGTWVGELRTYDYANKTWNPIRTYDEEQKGLISIDNDLFVLMDYNNSTVSESEYYNSNDGWNSINASLGNSGANPIIFKLNNEYHIIAGDRAQYLYKSTNKTGAWNYITCLFNHTYYSSNPDTYAFFENSQNLYYARTPISYLWKWNPTTGIASKDVHPMFGYTRRFIKDGDKLICVGGGNTSNLTYPYALLLEIDSSDWNNVIDHSANVIDDNREVILTDLTKKDGYYYIIGYTQGLGRSANILFRCDTSFNNWEQLDLQPKQAYVGDFKRCTVDSNENQLVVSKDSPVSVQRFTNVASLKYPDIQSLTFENNTLINIGTGTVDDLSHTHFIEFKNTPYITFNGSNNNGYVYKNDALDNYSNAFTLTGHNINMPTVVNDDLYISCDYFSANGSIVNYLEGSFRSDDGVVFTEMPGTQNYTYHPSSGNAPYNATTNFFVEFNNEYYQFGSHNEDGTITSTIYKSNNPVVFPTNPGYIWSSNDWSHTINYQSCHPVVFNNKIYFTNNAAYDISIVEFDPSTNVLTPITNAGIRYSKLKVINNKLYGFGYEYSGVNRPIVHCFTSFPNYIDYSDYIRYYAFNHLFIVDGLFINDDFIIVGNDNNSNEYLIMASKDLKTYTEIYRSPYDASNESFIDVIYDGNFLQICTPYTSNGLKIKRFSLNY